MSNWLQKHSVNRLWVLSAISCFVFISIDIPDCYTINLLIHVISKYQPCHFLSISGKGWTHLGPQRWNGLVDFILQHSQFWHCLWNYKYRKNKRYKGRILVVRYMYWIYPHQVYKIELQVSSFIANMNYWYRRAIITMQCSKRFVYIEMTNHFQR